MNEIKRKDINRLINSKLGIWSTSITGVTISLHCSMHETYYVYHLITDDNQSEKVIIADTDTKYPEYLLKGKRNEI